MKSLFFICTFLLLATYSFAQVDCYLMVTNSTGAPIIVGTQLTNSTANSCPITSMGSEMTPVIADGATFSLYIGTVDDTDPFIQPYIVGAYYAADGSGSSWNTNACWGYYPACSGSDGPLVITYTSCGNAITTVNIGS